MERLTAALLFAGCVTFQGWAQTPPAQPPAVQTPATEQAPAGQTASAAEPSQFPLDRFKDFSAIMIGLPTPGSEEEAHIYRSGDLMRMEGNEGRIYQISDLAAKQTRSVSRGGCLQYNGFYIRTYPFSMSQPGNTYERVSVGKETVDGHVCDVEDVTIHVANRPEPAKIRLWEAEDLDGFPVKVETKMHQVIKYKNIVLGPQDPTLFIFPKKTCQVAEKTIGKVPSPGSPPKKAPPAKSPAPQN